MNTQPIVYAAVLNYKNYEDTIECVHCLLASTYTNLHIVVVDNASGNDSLSIISRSLQSSFPDITYRLIEEEEALNNEDRVTLIQAKKNYGFAGGYNIVLKKLSQLNCFIFMVNPDVMVMPNTVEALVNFAEQNKKPAIIGCTIADYTTKQKVSIGGVKLNHFTGTVKELKQPAISFDYICGGALFFPSHALLNAGLFPEDYFLYWEDADWCYSAKQQGYQLLLCNNTLVYDKGGTSIGRGGYMAEYYYTRNSLIFHRKIGKQVFTIILASLLFRMPKRLLQGQFSKAKAVVAGTMDFLTKKF